MASDDNGGDPDGRAESIFDAVFDLPPADRPAAIAAACGDDADLRRRVETLFDALTRADRFLTDPTAVEQNPRARGGQRPPAV